MSVKRRCWVCYKEFDSHSPSDQFCTTRCEKKHSRELNKQVGGEGVSDRGGVMKERPILFSAEMVQAILDGSKTQTRRVIKPQPDCDLPGAYFDAYNTGWPQWNSRDIICPYGVPGDRLWVGEAWQLCQGHEAYIDGWSTGYLDDVSIYDGKIPPQKPDGWEVWFAADNPDDFKMHPDDRFVPRWRPSIHMPRWASRINLLIKNVRAERLQDISDQDAIAEGAIRSAYPIGWTFSGIGRVYLQAASAFEDLWDSIYDRHGLGWEKNPWVWVVEFEVIK